MNIQEQITALEEKIATNNRLMEEIEATNIDLLDKTQAADTITKFKQNISELDIPADELADVQAKEKLVTDVDKITTLSDVTPELLAVVKTKPKEADVIKEIMDSIKPDLDKITAEATILKTPTTPSTTNPIQNNTGILIKDKILGSYDKVKKLIDSILKKLPNETKVSIKKNVDDTISGNLNYVKYKADSAGTITDFPWTDTIDTIAPKKKKYSELDGEIITYKSTIEPLLKNATIYKGPDTAEFMANTDANATAIGNMFQDIVAEIEDTPNVFKIEYKKIMTGGGWLDDLKLTIYKNYLKQLKQTILSGLLALTTANTQTLTTLKQRLQSAPTQSNQSAQSNQSNQSDNIQPLISLLRYRIGAPTIYDTKLTEFCSKIGVDNQTCLSIYLSECKQEVEILMGNVTYPGALQNVLRLKKMSAYSKFLRDYGMSEAQIPVLQEKKYMFIGY